MEKKKKKRCPYSIKNKIKRCTHSIKQKMHPFIKKDAFVPLKRCTRSIKKDTSIPLK